MPQFQKTITLSKVVHHKQFVVLLGFDYDTELIAKMKQVSGARWSQTLKSWYIPEKMFDLHAFFEAFKELAYVDYSALKAKPTPFIVTKKKANN